MNIDWQNVAVGAIVLLAGLFLVRQALLSLRRKKSGGCGGGCPKCSTHAPTQEPEVTPIDLETREQSPRP